ncbi:MAG: chorismate mutase, partial [Atopobiaceae bacterium]|nr:chorismate mutase [Atopobiaceae bacterium]
MEDLTSARARIDSIDDEIRSLFCERMGVTNDIADYKRAHDLPVLDRTRERQHLSDVCDKVPEDLQTYAGLVFGLLTEVSKANQSARLGATSELASQIESAVRTTPELFPQRAYVACQGVEGAYSQIAADRLFKHPTITYLNTFEGVFRAVDEGLASYGVLPVENSTAGTV